MQKFPSAKAKGKRGAITETTLQGPVTIIRHGRPAPVITSIRDHQEYQRLKQINLKTEIRKGIEDLENGRYSEYDSMTALVEEIRQRGRKSLAELVARET